MVEKETCVPPQGKSVMKDNLCVVVTCWRKVMQPAVVEDVSAHSSGVENKPLDTSNSIVLWFCNYLFILKKKSQYVILDKECLLVS